MVGYRPFVNPIIHWAPGASASTTTGFLPMARLHLSLLRRYRFFSRMAQSTVAAEKSFDRQCYIARIALLINFVTQLRASLLVQVTILRFFKNGGHVRGDGIGPGVAIVAAVVAVQVTEIRNECRAWIDRKKNFFENWIRDRDAIIGPTFRMLIVQHKVERRESELSPIENAGRGQFRIVHFLDDLRRNFLGRIAIIS